MEAKRSAKGVTLPRMAAVIPAVPAELPIIDHDHDRLAELEAVVDRGLHVFVDVGLALATIRDERLYRATHPTFKAYLAQRWGFGQQWAYGRMYVAQVALAIDAEHGPLPAGISVEAIRPLVPLLHRDGADAVAQAWAAVQDRYGDRHRPPSRTEVRAVLVERGLTTCAPEPERLPDTGQIGVSLERSLSRVAAVRAKLNGRLLPPAARQRLTEWATMARVLAAELDALADGRQVAARLAAVEGDADGDVICDRHGHVRDEHGVCRWCGRPDRPYSWQHGR
jgi:hypothetical protein